MNKTEKGFTLIELLVVVAIIGIISSIALPQFNQYRTRAHNASALSDIRNVISGMEVYYADNEEYASCQINYADGTPNCNGFIPGIAVTDNETVQIDVGVISGSTAFSVDGCSSKGDAIYRYDSNNDGSLTTDKGIIERRIQEGTCATWIAS